MNCTGLLFIDSLNFAFTTLCIRLFMDFCLLSMQLKRNHLKSIETSFINLKVSIQKFRFVSLFVLLFLTTAVSTYCCGILNLPIVVGKFGNCRIFITCVGPFIVLSPWCDGVSIAIITTKNDATS